MQTILNCRKKTVTVALLVLMAAFFARGARAEVPDTNTYWKNLAGAEKNAKSYLDSAMQGCRSLNYAEAEAYLKGWTAAAVSGKHGSPDFNPCTGNGTLVTDKYSVEASSGRPIVLTEKGPVQSEWNFRTRTINLRYGGDLISISAGPISALVTKASLGSLSAQGNSGSAAGKIGEESIIGGIEKFWRSAHDYYPKHSLYDVALQVITGKDEGREMLLDFIRCGKSICQ